MRGYNRQKQDLQSFATPAKTREQVAASIAAGGPSPVQYSARRYAGRTLGGVPRYVDVTPINLRRAEPVK